MTAHAHDRHSSLASPAWTAPARARRSTRLRAFLEARGLRTRLLAFWDDVVVLSRYREGFVHKVFKSERGIGAPDKPVNRRDKNVRGWHVNLARHGLYLLDAINLRRVIARAAIEGCALSPEASRLAPRALRLAPRSLAPDVIIMDRYIHDELANLPLANPLTRAFIRLVAAAGAEARCGLCARRRPRRRARPQARISAGFSAHLPRQLSPVGRHAGHDRDSARRPFPHATGAIEQAFVAAWEKSGGLPLRPTAAPVLSDPQLPVAG